MVCRTPILHLFIARQFIVLEQTTSFAHRTKSDMSILFVVKIIFKKTIKRFNPATFQSLPQASIWIYNVLKRVVTVCFVDISRFVVLHCLNSLFILQQIWIEIILRLLGAYDHAQFTLVNGKSQKDVSLVFCVVFCRSLFVFLYFFLQSLYYLSFFDFTVSD